MPPDSLDHGRHTFPQPGAGDRVGGKYLLDRVLGQGGMGSVWLAHNEDLEAPVAIKLIHADATHSREAADRLKREARVEAQIEHRAIVRVFDCGETEQGDPFIVMEHLEGMSLADTLEKQGPMSATAAASMMLPVIDGLSTVHGKGIVHRDIKPENIFLARTSRCLQPKVVDFGIAKLDRWDPHPALTLQGTVLGSPCYMAPEQARGLDDVDHRADIWAVCAVLYEAVTGAPAFDGDGYNAIMRNIIEEEPPALTNSAAMADLWAVIERGLSKDRGERFQCMRDLGRALAQFLVAHGVRTDICGDSLATTWSVFADAPERSRRLVSDFSATVRSVGPSRLSLGTGSRARPRLLDRATFPVLASILVLAGSAALTWARSDSTGIAAAAERPAYALPSSAAADNADIERSPTQPRPSPIPTPTATPTPMPSASAPIAEPLPASPPARVAPSARAKKYAADSSTSPLPSLRYPVVARAIDDDAVSALGLKPFR